MLNLNVLRRFFWKFYVKVMQKKQVVPEKCNAMFLKDKKLQNPTFFRANFLSVRIADIFLAC